MKKVNFRLSGSVTSINLERSQYETIKKYCEDHKITFGELARKLFNTFVENGFSLVMNNDRTLSQFKEDLKKVDDKTLDSMFNKLTKEEIRTHKTKKNASWFYERFFNDMYDLYIHKAPPEEFAMIAQQKAMIHALVNERLSRGMVVPEDFNIDWDHLHRDAARIRFNPYTSFIKTKNKDGKPVTMFLNTGEVVPTGDQ